MLDAVLREVKETVLKPVAGTIGTRIHPNTITIIGAGVGILSGVFVLAGQLPVGLLLWGLNRLLDGLDGSLARINNQQSDFGGYLDILLDYLIYAYLPIMLALAFPSWQVMLALVLMLAAFYLNSASWMYLASLLEKRQQGVAHHQEKTSITMPTGLIEGTETVIFYTLFFLMPDYLTALYLIFAGLVLITVLQRLVYARKILT